jgi:hypothetical protein
MNDKPVFWCQKCGFVPPVPHKRRAHLTTRAVKHPESFPDELCDGLFVDLVGEFLKEASWEQVARSTLALVSAIIDRRYVADYDDDTDSQAMRAALARVEGLPVEEESA